MTRSLEYATPQAVRIWNAGSPEAAERIVESLYEEAMAGETPPGSYVTFFDYFEEVQQHVRFLTSAADSHERKRVIEAAIHALESVKDRVRVQHRQ